MIEIKIKSVGSPFSEEFRKETNDDFVIDLYTKEIRFQDETRKIGLEEKIYISLRKE